MPNPCYVSVFFYQFFVRWVFICVLKFQTINKYKMKQKVYLAGGFRSNWQAEVKKLDGFTWLDPREKERPNGVEKPMTINEYGTWDLHFIKQADIVFVYAERTNTSCIGLSVESGFAKGIGKTIILVLEPNHETIKDNYLQFLKKAANITFENLQDGLDYLQSFKIKD